MRRNLLLPLLLLAVVPAFAEEEPLFMWRAVKGEATIHLLGSVHAGRDAWYPLDGRIETALAAADTVACELDVSDPATVMQAAVAAQKEGMYPAGESLRDHVSASVWAELSERLGGMVPATVLERMRPGLVAMTLSQKLMAEAGLDVQSGVDIHVLQRARTLEKPIVALETVEEQIALLLGDGAVVDGLLLEEALALDPADMTAQLEDRLAAWEAGDPEAMHEAATRYELDDPRMTRFREQLLDERNQRMASALADRRGRWFVVIGSLHLTGAEGIPGLLADQGWQVSQVGDVTVR